VRSSGEIAHAIVCGQISSVTIKSNENLEFSLCVAPAAFVK